MPAYGAKLGNPKADAARARKAAIASAKKAQDAKAKDDAEWHDPVTKKKHELKRGEREGAHEQKAKFKAETKRMQEEEDAALKVAARKRAGKAKKGAGEVKVTRFELAKRRAAEEVQTAETEKEKRRAAARITSVEAIDRMIDEKPENRHDPAVRQGSGIDEALEAMTGEFGVQTPATYKEFETWRMPSLKEEKPGLKASQYREKLKKEWKRSPRHPDNCL